MMHKKFRNFSLALAVAGISVIAGCGSGQSSTSSTSSNPSTPATPSGHIVDLRWNPSSSSVIGYNIYRGTQPGGPYARISASPAAGTVYTDNNVQAGALYFYVVTAVDASAQESAFSNESSAQIPTP